MEPKFEQPKQYTPEEIAEMEKSRTISDAELLKGGAEYVVDEKGEKEMRVTNQHIDQISGDFEKEAREDRTLVMSQVISELEKFFEKGDKTKEDFKNEILPTLRKVAEELLETQGHAVSPVESRTDSYEPLEVVTCTYCQEIGLIFAGRLDLAKKISQLFDGSNKDISMLDDLWSKRGERIR